MQRRGIVLGPLLAAELFFSSAAAAVETPSASCPAPTETATIDRLCPAPSREFDSSVFRFLRDRLSEQEMSHPLLCSIESALMQAGEDCTIEDSGRTRHSIAELLRLVAGRWYDKREFNKADTAYGNAFELHGTVWPQSFRIVVLQSWANVKIDMGDSLSAKEMAERQAALAKDLFQEKPNSYVRAGTFVHSLRFQAYVYSLIGMTQESAALEERAGRIEAQVPPCEGLCDEFK